MDDFINGSLGNRYIDRTLGDPQQYNYQCVSYIKEYLRQVFKMNPGAWGNAADYWDKTNPALLTKFDKVTGAQKRGDIIMFQRERANFNVGHIGIVTKGGYFASQNYGSGNGDGVGLNAVREASIPQSKVLGMLRPKEVIVESKPTIETLRIVHALVAGWDINKCLSGEYDKQFKEAAGWKEVNSFIYEQFSTPAAGTWRSRCIDMQSGKKDEFEQIGMIGELPIYKKKG